VEQHKCWIAFQLPTERIEIEVEGERLDKPRVISKFFTVSLHEKSALRGFLESWRGRQFSPSELQGFDISNLIGANCQVNVIHKIKKNGSKRADIGSVMPLSKGMKKYSIEGEKLYFSWEDHGYDIPDEIPDGIKQMIMRSREYNELGQRNDSPNTVTNDPGWEDPPIDAYEEDVPF
jgi:hypothetical protein